MQSKKSRTECFQHFWKLPAKNENPSTSKSTPNLVDPNNLIHLNRKHSWICFLLRDHGSPQIQYHTADRKRRVIHVNQDVRRGDSAKLLSIMLLLYFIQRYERFGFP